MDEHELAKLRDILLARRVELLTQGDVEIEPNREDPTAKADEDAQPLNEMEQVIASRRNKQRADELLRVQDALQRMDRDPDEFGICLRCEEPILLRRLEVMPWARHCVACQQALSNPHQSTRRRHLADYLD